MAGAVVTLVTVILSATGTIGSGQAFALASPATTIILGGLIGMTVPDAWTAWRRGFRHGCEAALKSESPPPRLARLTGVAQLRTPARGGVAAADRGLPLAPPRGDVLDAEQGQDLSEGSAGGVGDPLD
jgi:hypothetical protein